MVTSTKRKKLSYKKYPCEKCDSQRLQFLVDYIDGRYAVSYYCNDCSHIPAYIDDLRVHDEVLDLALRFRWSPRRRPRIKISC